MKPCSFSINCIDSEFEFKEIKDFKMLDSSIISTLNEISSKSNIQMKFEKHPTVPTGVILVYGDQKYEGLGRNIKESRLEASKKALDENKLGMMQNSELKRKYKSPISELQEISQKTSSKLNYEFSSNLSIPHRPSFTCNCTYGNFKSEFTSSSKQKCKEECAKLILDQLQKLSLDSIPQKPQKLQVISGDEIVTPRDYQEEIYNKGVNSNIIACLATGTGKTFIAVMLIKKFSEKTFLPLPSGKRIIFLVPTVALVFQQSDYVSRHTNLKVGSFCGENAFGMEESTKWRDEFNKNDILVMTPEILKQLLQFAIYDISEICLLIFDECHHGINKGHPYNVIMTLYYAKKRISPINVPRIIGLSASPALNIKIDSFGFLQIKERIEQLEQIFDSQCITSLDHIESLKAVTSNPKIDIIQYTEDNSSILTQSLSKYLNEYKEKMHKFCIKVFDAMGINTNINNLYNVKIETKYGVVVLTSQKIQKSIEKCFRNCDKVLKDYGLFALNLMLKNMNEICCALCTHQTYQKYITVYQKLASYLQEMQQYTQIKVDYIIENLGDKSIQSLCNTSLVSNKIKSLILLLCKNYELNTHPTEEKQKISTLVFTAERSTCALLSDITNEFASMEANFWNISPRFNTTYVIGVSTLHYHQKLSVGVKEVSFKINNARLESFHNSRFSVLFATNVLEEGIDVRSCNIVIRFDRFSTLHSFIQSKGRIRQQQAKFYAFALEKDAHGVKTKITNMRIAEDSMENILGKYCVDEPEFNGDFDYFGDLPLDEYMFVTPLTQIDLRGSTSYIYQYCNKFSSKSEYMIKPRFYFQKEDGKIQCLLRLPHECGIFEDISSDFLNDKKLAKQHCCLRAIKLLYIKGKIDNSLTSVREGTRKPIIQQTSEKQNIPVNFYEKKIPQCLKYTQNLTLFSCYQIEFSEFSTCKSRESLYSNLNLNDSDGKIVILTPRDISSVSFPLASSVFSLQINVNPFSLGKIEFDNTKLDKIKEFNKVLINDFLRVMPKSCVWSPENGHYFLLFALFNKNNEIDYSVMGNFSLYTSMTLQTMASLPTVNSLEKSKMKGLLVAKNYLKDKRIYYVTNHDEVTSKSIITGTEKTYQSYFSNKYSKTLPDDETMLTCIQMSMGALNLLNNVVSFQTKSFTTIHLPASCVIHVPLSMALIFKLRAIPSIIKRLIDFIIIEDWCKDKLEIDGINKVDSSALDSFVHKMSFSISTITTNQKTYSKFFDYVDQYWNDSSVSSPKILFKSVFQALTRVSSNECCNYERMENLGDGFLRFILTMVLYVSNPDSEEGFLSLIRGRVVSNRYFSQLGKKIGVEKVINSKITVFGSNWCPPCSVVKKENFDMTANEILMYQYIPEKSIADVVESLVGCCLISSNISRVYEFLLKLNIFNNENISENFNTIKKVKEAFANLNFEYTNVDRIANDIRSAENIIKYTFKNKKIIAQAITHISSIEDRRQQSYERLELLGDAVIGFLVTLYLYLSHEEWRFKCLSPFIMSHLNHALINNKLLAIISSKIGLFKCLQLRSYDLHSSITHCLNCIENIDESDNFQEIPFLGIIFNPRVETFDSHRAVTVEAVTVPKPLGDIFESVIGAVFVDSNCDLVMTAKVFMPLIEEKLSKF